VFGAARRSAEAFALHRIENRSNDGIRRRRVATKPAAESIWRFA
jgi:hypothetical protein